VAARRAPGRPAADRLAKGRRDELRRWFGHDPDKWDQFRRRYFAELDQRPEACAPLLDAAATGAVTLLYSARDAVHNNAVALREYVRSLQEDVVPP
jgi:uncharacterized protein YeaO (DUF488 family)